MSSCKTVLPPTQELDDYRTKLTFWNATVTVSLTLETKTPKDILANLEKEEDLLKLQKYSQHTQLAAETNSETVADVQKVVYSTTDNSANPSNSVTIEMPKVCSYWF